VSWQQWERTKDWDPLREPAGWRSYAPAVVLGMLVTAAAHLTLVMILVQVLVGVIDPFPTLGTGLLVRCAIPAAAELGLACALGSWLCAGRLLVRDVPARRARLIALLTAAVVAAFALGTRRVVAVVPVTIPIHVVGALAGCWLGAALATRRATPADPVLRP
jgi:hypothetical protein